MEKYIYRPVRFYLITFACTWFWWLFAILLNEGTGLYLGMFLGLVSPAVVAVVTVFTSKNKALINDFKKKLIGFYRIKPKYHSKSTRHFPACSHNFPKAGEARFQGLSRLFRLLGKFPYLGESRRILMAVSSKTSSKTRFYYAATRRISSAAVQPSIWA